MRPLEILRKDVLASAVPLRMRGQKGPRPRSILTAEFGSGT